METTKLISYLDEYLKINDFQSDNSKNGLQVFTPKKEINKIGYAVDATSFTIQKAIENNVDLLIVHHGMFWGFETTTNGISYSRQSRLIKNDIGLYASHLPLDAHPQVGNNIGIVKGIANVFNLSDYEIQEFGEYNGSIIGFGIKFKQDIHIGSIISPFCQVFDFEKKLYNFGNKEYIHSIAVISGGGGDDTIQASQQGYDLYITGEMAHHQILIAKELGQSILIGGHRETEKIGVKLLANHINKEFGIQTMFIDEKYN